MHTARVGAPSAIMAQYMDPATRAQFEPLVTKFDSDPVRSAEGEWKRLAAATAFSVLAQDTPLLPSGLVAKVHEPRLKVAS
mmetsp:Transcript_1382/g.3170  ORF Transcript_1382/g.3170 Transcript_1382/m.3170 type:complete len:81 (-) Transcript_1382:40-282(-)